MSDILDKEITEALILVLFYAIIGTSIVSFSILFLLLFVNRDVTLNPYIQCNYEKYYDVYVCIAENITIQPSPRKIMGLYYWNTIYVNRDYLFMKEQIIKHEYCHHIQKTENRRMEELECWIKMWF